VDLADFLQKLNGALARLLINGCKMAAKLNWQTIATKDILTLRHQLEKLCDDLARDCAQSGKRFVLRQ
jgi:hypothetical protein